jgi:hypothetical protein
MSQLPCVNASSQLYIGLEEEKEEVVEVEVEEEK